MWAASYVSYIGDVENDSIAAAEYADGVVMDLDDIEPRLPSSDDIRSSQEWAVINDYVRNRTAMGTSIALAGHWEAFNKRFCK